ncbi:MAG: hypothetical protein JOZ80_16785 [Acidobacteriaceae bacterium]|nr:hypothetical protein [Acidobacteriaceae bacterium]
MRAGIALLFVSLSCVAQSSFDNEHTVGVKENPPGITLTLATADGHNIYNLSDDIPFTLSFTTSKLHRYTVELSGGSLAGASDDVVLIGPEMAEAVHSRSLVPVGYPCCESNRRYITRAPRVRFAMLSLTRLNAALRFKWPLYRPPRPDSSAVPSSELKAGDYEIFIQTRSVMRGWPRSEKETFHAESDFVVTSNNVLHVKILQNASKKSGFEH